MTKKSKWMRSLFIILGTAPLLGEPALTQAAERGSVMAVSPQALKFEPIPNMPSCASAAILRGNPRSGPAWVLLKLASGCRVPWHWHTPNEELIIISGRGSFMMKDGPPLQFVPGAYASLPSHHIHQASCSRACLLFNSADGAFDIHYVDTKDEEISADKALKQPVAPVKKKRPKK